jgi:hypothetical protein
MTQLDMREADHSYGDCVDYSNREDITTTLIPAMLDSDPIRSRPGYSSLSFQYSVLHDV